MREWSMQRKLYIYPALLEEVPALDDRMRMEYERLRAAYERTPGMAGNGGGHTGPGDPCGDLVANVIEPLSQNASVLLRRWLDRGDVIRDVDAYIDSLDALEQQVMKLRYFKRCTWDAICDSEGYSRATACRLHSSAVGKCKSGFYKCMIQNETL